nr:hypothetical protein [Micromonospora qiuiae]
MNDGLLVGCFLTEDLDAAQAAMETTEVNARWQAGWRRSSPICPLDGPTAVSAS